MPRTVRSPSKFDAIFDKAEEHLGRFFQGRRDDPTKGAIEISNERFVLVRAAALSVEFFDIFKNIFSHSEQEAASIASQVLFDVAHALGKADASHFHKTMGLLDPISKLSAGPVFFAHTGWAFVNISEESKPEPNENYYLLYDHPYSFEADAWICAGRRSDFPVCFMNAGYSSGWCEESFGLSLTAREVCCRGKGDEACRFIMAPPDRIDAHVARHLGNTPARTKKISAAEIWKSFDRDWTKERLLEKELGDSERDYRGLFEASPDAIIVWNKNDIVHAANASAATLFGYEQAEDMIGRNWQDFVAPEDRQARVEGIRKLEKSGGVAEAEFRMQRRDGSRFFVQNRIFMALDRAGNPCHAIGIARDITERKATEAELRALARHDPLTGLANRPAFLERLQEVIASTRRGASGFAVLYFDLDRFKDVNDTLGHADGDRLLQAVADRLQNEIRESDFTARFGGDEFAVLQTGLNDSSDAGALAEKLLKSMAAPYQIDGNEVHVTVSVGISIFDPQIVNAEAMLDQADLALYRAKEEGRDRYCFHSAELDREVRQRVELANELRAALDAHELELYYQPQVELASGRIIGLEGLARWNHPRRGLLMPAVFIPIAERTGTICALGRWVLDEVCRQIKAWRDQGITPPPLAINVSAAELRSCSEFEEYLAETLTRWGVARGDIELELTESVLMETTQTHKETLARLYDLGTSIAIDDFGSGYSSLAYLSAYPVSRLKIAQQFILGIPGNAVDMAITKATLSLGRELGIRVIAEGVETKAQLDFLLSAGCTIGQGFYFSQAVQAERAGDFLSRGFLKPVLDSGEKHEAR